MYSSRSFIPCRSHGRQGDDCLSRSEVKSSMAYGDWYQDGSIVVFLTEGDEPSIAEIAVSSQP